MRVVVLYNQPVLPLEHPEADSDHGVAATVDDVSDLLASAGFQVSRLGVGRNLRGLASEIKACRPAVVFNLFEGFADQPESEITVARILEELQIPFTGSPSQTLDLALNKHLAKQHLWKADLPTPWFFVAHQLPLPDMPVPWPVIVKPARRDASEGIDQGSVVTTPCALAAQVAKLLDCYGSPVLIEQFISGREFTVALLETPELVVLPITEVQFVPSEASPWPIFTYAAKWLPDSPDFVATPLVYGAMLPQALSCRLVALAKQAFTAIGCRDYARIDLRLTESGEPCILEVNPNPDLSPLAYVAEALSAAGLDRGEMTANLVRRAAARGEASLPSTEK